MKKKYYCASTSEENEYKYKCKVPQIKKYCDVSYAKTLHFLWFR